jgi:competence protein ComEC
MLAVVLGAVMLRRPIPPMNTLAAALLLVLLVDPLAVLAPGFWFSFMAVAVIAYGYAGRIGRGNLWWRFGRIHWLITLALFPLSLFLFQQSSIIAPLANLFMVPWVSLVVVPLTLVAALLSGLVPDLASLLFDLADSCLEIVWPTLHSMAALPIAKWVQQTPSLLALLLASCGVMLLLAPRGFPQRWLGGVMLLPMLLMRPPVLALNEFHATVLDVGQGLSVLIQTRSHTLLFDTGPRWGDDADAGERLIVPFLRHQGIAHLDKLVISNGDADHIGGAASILSIMQVTELTGQDIDRLLHDRKTPCATGQHWIWDGVSFEFLHPDQSDTKRNNYSCVLKVSNGVERLLIAADIEKKIERRLLDTQFDRLQSEVLVVPHHGSKTSSTAGFIAAVQPRYALVSAGYRNRFGHPAADVIERYHAARSQVITTADAGAIMLKFDTAPGLAAVLNRQQSRHYWNASLTP